MLTDRYTKEQLILQELLREIRIEHSLTQEALAERLEVPQSLVSKYESGERHLSFVELFTICAALDMNISAFSVLFEERLDTNESK